MVKVKLVEGLDYQDDDFRLSFVGGKFKIMDMKKEESRNLIDVRIGDTIGVFRRFGNLKYQKLY